MKRLKKIFILLFLLFFMSGFASVTLADTVAYWRFDDQTVPDINFIEGVPTGVVEEGSALPDINDINGWDAGWWRKAVHDWSGNGNHLTTWEYAWAGHEWDSNVPAATVILTGATNTLSVQNAGDYPSMFTWSAQSSPGPNDIEEIEPEQFTIEASFMHTGDINYRTIVGRDAASVNTETGGDLNRSALYFQIRPNSVAGFMFTDVSGYWHQIYSASGILLQNRWYNMVGVCDGQTMSLYVEDVNAGDGFHLVGQTDLTTSESPDMALTNGKDSSEPNGTNWYAGAWTVGRGMYNAGHTDRFLGYIDEVRISDSALKLSECLFAEASDPDPADNSIQTSTSLDLTWEPISWADAHDIYFGTDFNDVRDANRANHSQPGLIYYVPDYDSNSYPVSSLTTGEYYWRVDEVNDTVVGSKGAVWSFLIAPLDLSVSPVNRYSFIDGDTVAVDDVGGKDGTFDGTAALADNKLSLDGSGSVHLPSDTLDTGLTSVTIEAWFEYTSNENQQHVFDFGETADSGSWPGHGGNCMFYAPHSDSVSRFTIGTNGIPSWQTGEISVSSTIIPLNTSTQIACVYDGSVPEIRLYQDGALIGTQPVTSPHSLAAVARDNAYIGDSSYNPDPYLSGIVEEFRIYDVALTLPEVAASYLAGPDVYRATNPSPAHGAFTSKDLTLSWDSGAKAEVHDVYVDPNKTDVVNATSSDHSDVEFADIGWTSNSYLLSSLTPEETYFWRVDEVNNTEPNMWRGNIWSFTVSPLKASQPLPYNGEICVFNDPCTILSWKRGNDANQSKLYFGTNPASLDLVDTITQDDVNDRYSYTMEGEDKLDLGIDYYWRVNEFNSVTSTTWEGDVWHFTTIPNIQHTDPHLVGWWQFDEGPGKAIDWSGLGQHGTVYGATSVEGYEGDGVNFNGSSQYVELPIGETISTLDSATIATWVNFTGQGTNFPRIFDFGNDVNENMYMTSSYGWTVGPLRFAITLTSWDGDPGEFSVEDSAGELPTAWHHVAVAIDGDSSYMTLFLDGAAVDNEVTEVLPSDLGVTVNNWLGRSQYTSDAYFNGTLDNFYIYDYAMTEEDLKTVMASKVASLPDPANNAIDVNRYPVLSWEPGKYAASADGHKLYYGTDFNDVNGRIGDPVVLTDPCYAIPGPNAPYGSGLVIYWVVDEVNDSHPDKIWYGNVWQFTIKDYSFIDDFDGYSETGKPDDPLDPPPADSLKSVWVDGNYAAVFAPPPDGKPGTSGSLVQLNTDTTDGAPSYAHYVPDDNDIAQSGAQSMKFYYDNDGYVTWEMDLYGRFPASSFAYTPVPDTYLSEAYAAIDDAAQTDPHLDSLDLLRDWSIYNVLRLSFFGDPNNDQEPMYVALEDGDGTLVAIQHPDPNLTIQQWKDWNIKLSDFTDKDSGLALGDIAKVYIGFGIKDDQQPGGTGAVFFDDIYLSTGVCIPGTVAGDFDDDCTITNSDLRVLTNAKPWYGEKPLSLPTPIINLDASAIEQAIGTQVDSWSNAGSMLGAFTDFKVSDDNAPVLEMVEGKRAVTFNDINDLLIWDHNAPPTLTADTNAPNDFTVVFEVFNTDIGVEEWVIAWAKRGMPDGTFAAFGYGTHDNWGATAHQGTAYDMGFGPLGAPSPHTWHTIAYVYDGNTESIVVDGLVYDTETKDLIIDPNQPVVIGGVYEPAEDGSIKNAWNPDWDLRYIGSVASIKVYAEAIPAVELALWMGSPADLRIDDKIDFRDIAVLGNSWMQDPYLFGKDY